MSLSSGTRLGAYEITSKLGAGGMGEVYRATDSKLRRDVAIKVLPAAFTEDADRLERFEREAQLLAQLHHPNIASIFGLEESGGTRALVMEMVEGEDLSARIARGPVPIDEALPIARQIAEALEAAHAAGIIHRDLKPANVKVKADGTVKVLDFGLAKAMEPTALSGGNLANSPTLTGRATQLGMIMGTAAYMAPEQARGSAVDKRVDIWAFGVVLYEMLTGKKPFVGEDVSTILAAVIQAEPRWDGVPRSMQRLLRKCLEKDPRKRLRDIGDMWHVLDDEAASIDKSSTSGNAGWIAAAALAIVAGVALWAPWRNSTPPVDRPLVRFDVDLGSEVALPVLDRPTPSTFAISPDGTRLVYVASVSGAPPKLFTRRLAQRCPCTARRCASLRQWPASRRGSSACFPLFRSKDRRW